VQQRPKEGPVGRGEPHLLPAQPAFQRRDLMTQGQDLDVLGRRRSTANVFVTVK
jgi:hypothetical protein